MGSGRADEAIVSPISNNPVSNNPASGNPVSNNPVSGSPANDAAFFSLERVLRGGKPGFYFLIASPRTQAAVMGRYAGENLGVYDFAGESRELLEMANLIDREPGRRAYVFLNFHLALWDGNRWNNDAARRLNFSRNALASRNRTLIFCITPEADNLLNRRAYDFYDYIKLFFRFEDEMPPAAREIASARPEDKSVGVHVTVDFSLPEEELLALAVSLGNQAEEFYQAAHFADALDLYQNQRAILERVYGAEHSDTAGSDNKIGMVYYSQGDYFSALEWFQKAMRIREKALGTEHPDTAYSYFGIGIVYQAQGDYTSALEWLKKTMQIWENTLGAEHPHVAVLYYYLGVVYSNLLNFRAAKQYYLKALQIQEHVLGADHPDTVQTRFNLTHL